MPQNNKKINIPSILDFEASGFGGESYPIEVGVVLATGALYCALIKPEPSWLHWCTRAAKVHGIPRQRLVNTGKSVQQVCNELNQLLAGSKIYSDGWTYDKAWLNRLYQAAEMSPSFVLSPIEAITCDEQLNLWDDTKLQVEQQLGLARHRASNDAVVIQQTFIRSYHAILCSQSYHHSSSQEASGGCR